MSSDKTSVTASAPAIFPYAIVNPDGTLNDVNHPVAAGAYVEMYGTGLGQTNPAGVDGAIVTDPAPVLLQTVGMTIGDEPATVISAGPVPGLVSGILQIQAVVPADLDGTVPVVASIGGIPSQAGVTLVVQQMLPVDEMRRPVLPRFVRSPRQ